MTYKLKAMTTSLLCAAGLILSLTGCATNWADLTPDKQEAPASLVQNEQKLFEARKRVRKTARLEWKKPVYAYNSHWYGNLTEAQVSDTFTRQFGKDLTARLATLPEISLIDPKSGGNDTDMVIYCQITRVVVHDSNKKATNRGITSVIGASFHDRQSGHIVQATGNGIQLFVADVKADVEMLERKTGNNHFTCTVQTTSVPSPICTQADLNACMNTLAKLALQEYQFQFGPPIFVTESRHNGEMVRINIGSDHGVTPGMKFYFYTRNAQGGEQQIGTGHVRPEVPEDLGKDYARLIVDGQGKTENFRVMKNILAKPVR